MLLLAKSSCIITFVAVLGVGVALAGQDSGVPRKVAGHGVTKEAVWNADKQGVLAAKQRCSEYGGRQLEECFADAMESLGASVEAASFTRYFGSGIFVRKFREAGRVDVAYVIHPFRANEPSGVFLVNGEPPIIDVDDITLLPKEAMEQDRAFSAIRKTYPKATLWPGDRSGKYPIAEPTVDGGQAFTVPYTLRNFCHSCEVLGTVYFSFEFDREGRLGPMRFLRVDTQPRKVVSKTDLRKESEQIRFIVMAEEGKEFTVRLESNRTTGYQWRPAEPLDERVVKVARSEYVPFETATIGAGGEEVWTFLANGKGEAEVTMEYVRPWEKGQSPIKTATIKVSVRPNASK